MADSSTLQTLLSTKAALDLGLITQADFDSVKSAFLRSQQIKAAVDTGLIKSEDYESVKREYLSSLEGLAASGSTGVAAPVAAPAPAVQAHQRSSSTPSFQTHQPQQQQQPARPQPPAPPPRPPAPAPAAAEPAAPAPPPAPVGTPAAPAAAPAAVNGAVPAATPARSGTGGTEAVPTNIPKMGGAKAKSGGTSMSGISVSEDAVNLFYLIKAKSTYRWALWQVDETGSTVVIAAVGGKDSTYADFLAALPDADCRYGVFDYRYTAGDGQVMNKLVFLNWAPDSARVKAKMMYASTKDFFKGHLDGLSAEFQASDLDEITEEEVSSAVRALKRS